MHCVHFRTSLLDVKGLRVIVQKSLRYVSHNYSYKFNRRVEKNYTCYMEKDINLF